MTNTGLFFGKFAPLTKGHIFAIHEALKHVKHLDIVLCYDEKFQNTLSDKLKTKLSLRNRLKCIYEEFGLYANIFGNISIHYVDESNIPSYPNGFSEFTKLVVEKTKVSDYDCVFSSEFEYDDYFRQEFPNSKHIIIDGERKHVPISATKIRNNPYKYFEYIADSYKPLFRQKVCIIGVESTGKSTLTKNLAKHFDTYYISEVGREICEVIHYCSEYAMNELSYINIAIQHKISESENYSHYHYCNNGVKVVDVGSREYDIKMKPLIFCDTNNLITYFSAYCTGINSNILLEMSKNEVINHNYDLVLFLDIDVEWIDDPLRMNYDSNRRKETHEILIDMCDMLGVEYKFISSNGDYINRTNCAINVVEDYIKQFSEK